MTPSTPSTPGGRPIAPQVWARPEPALAPSPTPNVRSLIQSGQDTAAPRAAVPGSWMGPMYQLAVQHLTDAVGAVFDPSPELRESLHETEGVGAWRDVRLRRNLAQQALFDKIRMQVSAFAKPVLPVTAAPVEPHLAPPRLRKEATDWGLMEEGHLDEHLAQQRETDKARQVAGPSLAGLSERLAWLRKVPQVAPSDNPLDPKFLLDALWSVAPPEWPAGVRTGLARRIDAWFLPALAQLYPAWDTLLYQQGVGSLVTAPAPRPAIKPEVLPDPVAARTAPAAPSTGSLDTARLIPALIEGPQADAWNSLRRLLDGQRQPVAEAAPQGLLDGVVLPDWMAELEAKAPRLQVDDHILLSTLDWLGTQPRQISTLSTGTPDALKLLLRKRLREAFPSPDSQEPVVEFGDHEAALDAVGAVFAFVLTDPQIPQGFRLLLSRLQLPFVRAAILDPALFAQPQHPARRLLNALAEIGQGWEHSSDRAAAMHEAVQALVVTVTGEHAQRAAVMAEQAEVAERMLLDLRQRAERIERRLVEALDGRERRELARRTVATTFQTLLGSTPHVLPEWLVLLIHNLWTHHTVLVLVRHGEESEAYRAAVQWVGDIVAGGRARMSPDDRSDLHLALPRLVKQLREGLAMVSVPEDDQKRMGQQLEHFVQQQMDPRRLSNDGRWLDQIQTVPGWAQPVEMSIHTMITHSPATQAVLDALQVGDWLLCRTDHDETVRGKIAWITRPRDRVLLVNFWGVKLAEVTMADLAIQMEQGMAQRFSGHPLVERALAALTKRLEQGRSTDADGAKMGNLGAGWLQSASFRA